ncbi:hypothetical protein [Vibrio chagasii]|uniref:hypothetical protein n=1 Tax=Vibrio chagasii TaxID=170679 RepID=UPI002283EA6E|nr:hypothetical protein [Vibrio chagasii]MCY9829334.1 hypothetical protein [Vibrio chagasii]
MFEKIFNDGYEEINEEDSSSSMFSESPFDSESILNDFDSTQGLISGRKPIAASTGEPDRRRRVTKENADKYPTLKIKSDN